MHSTISRARCWSLPGSTRPAQTHTTASSAMPSDARVVEGLVDDDSHEDESTPSGMYSTRTAAPTAATAADITVRETATNASTKAKAGRNRLRSLTLRC